MESFKLYFESSENLDQFKKKLLGAFRIVFDLDQEDTNNKEIHTPYSQTMGLRSYDISYDYRCPENANNAISVYFPIKYKLNPYIVDVIIREWNTMPTFEDFNKNAKGVGLERKKNPINSNSVFTTTGSVKRVEDDYEFSMGSVEPEYDGENFHQFLIRDGNMMNLAKRIKEIIDGKDKRKPTKPIHTPTPSNTKSPKLVSV